MTTNNAVNTPLSGSTGTGSFVGSISPTLVTPNCGTPSAINLSNATNFPVSALPSGTLFNFQQAQLTTPVSTTSSSFSTITGLSVTITPTSSSSKILIRAVIQSVVVVATNQGFFQLFNGTSAIGVGTSVGSRTACGASLGTTNGSAMSSIVMEWLDSPATTSPITYSAQYASNVNTQSVFVNQIVGDANAATTPRTVSTISVCEVHA